MPCIPEMRKGALLFLKTDVLPAGYRRLSKLERMGLPPWPDGPIPPEKCTGKSLKDLGIMVIVKK